VIISNIIFVPAYYFAGFLNLIENGLLNQSNLITLFNFCSSKWL